MAQPSPQSLSTLRAVTYRITTTPSQELPLVVAQISAAIWSCRDLISLPSENKQNREKAEILKRFHTRIGSLLQERSIEGRWAAVVLVKATIEAGGLEVLSKCNAWVKTLIGYLKKPDPPTTRNLTLITLTRIFMLTWDYSNLVREITTPNLTALVPICLSNLENKRCSSKELETILEAFVTLLPRHPTIFRNNEAKLRSILSSVLSGVSLQTGSRCAYSESQRAAAERLLVLLHHCAPKQGSSEKWADTLKAHTQAAHATCDRVFRAVHEHWQSATGVETSAPVHQIMNGDLESENEDAAGLKPWKGVFAGSERLIALLRVIDAHLTTATSASISVPIGILEDLLARVFSVVPAIAKQDSLKANNQISKDEREAMFAALPRIHVAALRLTASIYSRFQSAASALVSITTERILPVFQAQHDDGVREAVFSLVQQFVDRSGLSMTRNEVSDLSPVLKAACQEIFPASELKSPSQNDTGGVKQQLGLSGGQVTQSHPTNRSAVVESARNLLHAVLRKVDAGLLGPQIRAQIDRAAIVTRDQQLLTASVMNPARKNNSNQNESSLMTFLAREFGGCTETEALLRPRMPLVRVAKSGHEEDDEAENASEDEENDDDELGDAEDVEMEEIAGPDGAGEEAEQEVAHAPDPSFDAAQGADEDPLPGDSKAVLTASEMSSTGKRRADDGVDAGGAFKRAKTNSPKPQMPPTVASAPVNSSQATFASAVPEQPDFGDDDSDLEIPALNPDSDTDPEDAAEDSE
ncbi:Pre-rRNA-processing protein rix1 [Pseudocercospora fuligena]|uniref:Pre-rRNA-processing protein RIX1 n=1 Tax=Pseudocercospora fuligena TaxID=685502 RepID=A0A8H6VGP1_9PEZI|nr:Pre-rRNA-processing protein rix1 [Pseudocercospora fuligena]